MFFLYSFYLNLKTATPVSFHWFSMCPYAVDALKQMYIKATSRPGYSNSCFTTKDMCKVYICHAWYCPRGIPVHWGLPQKLWKHWSEIYHYKLAYLWCLIINSYFWCIVLYLVMNTKHQMGVYIIKSSSNRIAVSCKQK